MESSHTVVLEENVDKKKEQDLIIAFEKYFQHDVFLFCFVLLTV